MTDEPELSYAALAATLELSRLRSLMMVGAALVTKFPTDEDWWALTADLEYVESLNALAEVLNDIRQDAKVDQAMNPEAVAEAAENHYGRALEAIELVAERLEVPAEDLLNVLISA